MRWVKAQLTIYCLGWLFLRIQNIQNMLELWMCYHSLDILSRLSCWSGQRAHSFSFFSPNPSVQNWVLISPLHVSMFHLFIFFCDVVVDVDVDVDIAI